MAHVLPSKGVHHLSELADTLCMIMDSAVRIASDVPVIVTFLHQWIRFSKNTLFTYRKKGMEENTCQMSQI